MPVRTRSASRAPTINETSSSEDEVVLRRRGSSSSLLSPSNSDSENERGTPSKQKRTRAKKFTRSISSASTSEKNKKTPTNNDTFDVEAYLEKRVMTSAQEYFNAITMVPGMVCAVYFILSGCWMASHHRHYQEGDGEGNEDSGWVANIASEMFGSIGNGHGLFQSMGCINSSTFPAVTALPPLALVAGALGNLVHSPVSIYYHWKCATTIEPPQRIIHWARRADNASIHFASICASYATSGRMDYCLLNLIFNVDCMFKQLEKEVHPRRNQMRLGCSILMYLLPVLVNGHYALFGQFILMFGLGGYLFGAYPVGGWSHGLFHIVLSFLPYLVFQAAIPLPSSQEQIKLAVNCAGMAVGQP